MRNLYQLVLIMGLIVISGCGETDAPTAPSDELPLQKSVVKIYVNQNSTSGPPDGSAARPFLTIGDALTVAEKNAIIDVAPGTYEEQVVVTVDGVALIASQSEPQYDELGYLTGFINPTRIVSDIQSSESIVELRGKGNQLSGFEIRGSQIYFRNGGILANHARNVLISDNIIWRVFIAIWANDGEVTRNTSIDFGFLGLFSNGSDEGTFVLETSGNRWAQKFEAGQCIIGAVWEEGLGSTFGPGAINIKVLHNDLSNNYGAGLQFLYRGCGGTGRCEPGANSNDFEKSSLTALIFSNSMQNNGGAGFNVEAGGSGAAPATMYLDLHNNNIADNAQVAYFTFRLRYQDDPPYVSNSSIIVNDPDGSIIGFWYDNPDEFNNLLQVNGEKFVGCSGPLCP